MAGEPLPLGIFTTDARLVIRTWDAWLARATGIPAERALERPLAEVVPDVRTRGVLGAIESVVSQGTVEVLSPALHRYLFACAPSVPVEGFDRMQQHVTIGPLRNNGRITGVIVTIEDVTARVARERELADRLTDPGPRHIESLAALLGEKDWRTRRTAVATLVGHGSAIVETLVRTLREQHENFDVLSSALDLLAISDVDVTEPLIGFLEDGDANLRTQAALILGERRDRLAIPHLIARLDDPDPNVQFHAIEALGRLHATEACDALAAVAERRSFFLSFPAIQALSTLGNPSIAPRLVPLLGDELLRAPVVEALGHLGSEEVVLPLVRLLNAGEAPPDVVADALAAVHRRYEERYGAAEHVADVVRRSIAPPGTQALLDAVNRVGPDRLHGLATVLGWLEGEAVQRALTRLLGHHTVRSQVVEALVRHGSRVVALLTEQLRAEDLETRQAAAVALGRIGDRRATPPLIAALGDPELTVPAAGALARIGDPDAFEPLIALVGAPDAAVRQAVIAALNSIGHPEMPPRIAALLDDQDAHVRESALRIAGYFGYDECLDRVLACCRDEAETVRRTAVEQLSFFEDPRAFAALVAASGDAAASVRAAAAAALGRSERPERLDALVRALEDGDAWVRYAALRSLGAVGDAAAAPAVAARLQDDRAPQVRLAAIEVFGRLGGPGALEVLEPLTHSADQDISRAAVSALGHLDEEGALAALEDFARSPDPSRRLAAVDALSARRERRVPEVLQWVAAAEGDPAIASAAVDALSRIASRDEIQAREATRVLIALTAEPSRREAAITALAALPARRVPDIAAGLRHAATEVRRATVEALSRMKRPDTSRALEAALDDAAASVRLTAVAELKNLGARSSHGKLMAMARADPDDEVRHAAMLAVARTDATGGAAGGRE